MEFLTREMAQWVAAPAVQVWLPDTDPWSPSRKLEVGICEARTPKTGDGRQTQETRLEAQWLMMEKDPTSKQGRRREQVPKVVLCDLPMALLPLLDTLSHISYTFSQLKNMYKMLKISTFKVTSTLY